MTNPQKTLQNLQLYANCELVREARPAIRPSGHPAIQADGWQAKRMM